MTVLRESPWYNEIVKEGLQKGRQEEAAWAVIRQSSGANPAIVGTPARQLEGGIVGFYCYGGFGSFSVWGR